MSLSGNLFYVRSRQLRSVLSHACVVLYGVDEIKGLPVDKQPNETLFISDPCEP